MGTLQPAHTLRMHVLYGLGTHPVCTGLATGLMLSEVSVAGLLGIRESSSNSFEGCVWQGRAPMGTGSYLGVLSLPTPHRLTTLPGQSPATGSIQTTHPMFWLCGVGGGSPQQGMPGGPVAGCVSCSPPVGTPRVHAAG